MYSDVSEEAQRTRGYGIRKNLNSGRTRGRDRDKQLHRSLCLNLRENRVAICVEV